MNEFIKFSNLHALASHNPNKAFSVIYKAGPVNVLTFFIVINLSLTLTHSRKNKKKKMKNMDTITSSHVPTKKQHYTDAIVENR